jgi:hypothetical protein
MQGAGVTNSVYEGPSTDTNRIELGAPTTDADQDGNLSQAKWESSPTTIPNEQFANAKYLCLELTTRPVSNFQIIWRSTSAPATYWEDSILIDDDGNIVSGKGVTWDAATGLLTIELSLALKDYASYKSRTGLGIIVAHFGPGFFPSLGFKSAYLLMQ